VDLPASRITERKEVPTSMIRYVIDAADAG
jgi:hypothetical protein